MALTDKDPAKQAVKDKMAKAKEQQRNSVGAVRPEGNTIPRRMEGAPQQQGVAAPNRDSSMVMRSSGSEPGPVSMALPRPQGTDVFGLGMQREMIHDAPEIHGVHFDEDRAPDLQTQTLDEVSIREFQRILNIYRTGKKSVDQRVINAERWWKMRNAFMQAMATDGRRTEDGNAAPVDGFQAETAWLHNVVTSKHADALEAYPVPNVLPREEMDKLDAWALSRILPVVLEQNDFHRTYDMACWQKLKTGTAIYQVVWDREKLNGLGDIAVNRISQLNLFWEPGVADIQDSRYVFHVESLDKDLLQERYPQISDRHLASTISISTMPHDDYTDTTEKVEVVDVYYKKGKRLHYVKYVGDIILYATENDPERRDRGLYDHGLFPFVFDVLFPIEDSPAGYGYIDICANPQIRIDLMNSAFIKNTMAGATPRYFHRANGGVNAEQFLDLNETLISVDGNLGEDSLRLVDYKPLNGNYINFLDSAINELRETTGNTETSTGSSTNGVTAASALAALQEASGKTSRASIQASYRCYQKICELCIELIRQYYDLPREFRITGAMGVQKYMQFSNAGMQPQHQGSMGGVDLGYRKPIYDITVHPEKRNSYTKMAQNELAIQLYSLGLFNPQNVDQALMCLEMMDFEGKDELTGRIARNGTMFQQLQLYKAMAATLAAKYEPALVGGLLNGGPVAENPVRQGQGTKDLPELKRGNEESSHVTRARERAQNVSQVDAGGGKA